MRVAIVCPYAWDRPGGVQSHIRSLSGALKQRSHDVEVWAPAAGSSSTEDGVRVFGRAVGIPANGSVAPVSFGPAGARGIRRALKEFRPDLLHLHEPMIPSLSLQALLLSKLPAVATFHAASESSLPYRLAAPVLKLIAKRLKARVAVSEAARSFVSRYIPGSYEVIPNGIDIERFAIRRPRRPRSILFVGRLEERKGLEVLLRAAASVPDVQVTVAGVGPREGDARALAQRLGVDVRWLGVLDEDELPEVFASSTIYCAPNVGGESFGIVLLEAMAAGTPVVSSDLEAFVEVGGHAVCTFPTGDHVALAGELTELLDHESERKKLSAAGRRRAKEFDWSELVGEIEAIYEASAAPG